MMRIIAEVSDFVDDHNVTASHKILLRFSYHSLEQGLCTSPGDVDLRDSSARTPVDAYSGP
jgi:hypothetical protein